MSKYVSSKILGLKLVKPDCIIIYFFQLGLTQCKAEQQLQCMGLQDKDTQKY